MPESKKSITKTRKNLNALFHEPGIHPVTVRGEFKGVILSIGDVRKKTAGRLEKQLAQNEKVTLLELLEIIKENE